MHLATFYALTWATGLAAVIGALLLAGADASLPDSGALGDALVTEMIGDAPEPSPAAPRPPASPAQR